MTKPNIPRILLCLGLWAVLFTAGCDFINRLPTIDNRPDTAAMPTLRPTAVQAVATIDPRTLGRPLTQTVAVTDTPSTTPTATITPTRTPRPTATPDTTVPQIVMDEVGLNGVIETGTLITVTGRAQKQAVQTVEIVLRGPDGRVLVAAPIELGDDTRWQAPLVVPRQTAGDAVLLAGIFGPDGTAVETATQNVRVAANRNDERYLALNRPTGGAWAVGGDYLFFDGWAQRPGGGLSVSLRDADCGEELAEQTYRLNGSGYWQGYLVIPDDLPTGPACAVAAFGSPDTAEYREVLVPVEAYPATADVPGVQVVVPAPGAEFTAGDRVGVQGIAHDVPDGRVSVRVQLANGRIVATDIVAVESYGYWETAFLLPVDESGEMLLTVSIGTGRTDATRQDILLTVQPDG